MGGRGSSSGRGKSSGGRTGSGTQIEQSVQIYNQFLEQGLNSKAYYYGASGMKNKR